jgi:hypothetical protein
MGQSGETAGIVMEDRAGQSAVLASDADRDGVAGMLSSAFAEGRLTSGEHAERVRAAYAARTLGELAGLTADLPGPAGDPNRQRVLVPGDGVDRCLLCALLICCPPAGIAWLLAARRRAHRVTPSAADRARTDVRGTDW